MNYLHFIDMFGSTSDDETLGEILREHGVASVPPIPRDQDIVTITIDAAVLRFSDPQIWLGRTDIEGDASAFTGITLTLRNRKTGTYSGPLPFEIEEDATQEQLRVRFGVPSNSDEDLCWDQWIIDGLSLRVAYTDEFDAIETVSVSLPRVL